MKTRAHDAELCAIIGVIIGLGAILVFATIPIASPFAGTTSTAGCTFCGPAYSVYIYLEAGKGAPVQFSWNVVSSSASVNLIVYDGGTFCGERGTDGSCSFTSLGGGFQIVFSDENNSDGAVPIHYDGSISSPLL
ncbi:MAG: hypothetical protein WBG19_02720 [Thermoplasmata archaeon]